MNLRIEIDSLGGVEVPADRYWGAQTQRSLQSFDIGGHRFPPSIITAFGIVKRAAAVTNQALGKLEAAKAELICTVCDEIIAGRWNDEFPLVVWQTGSGTQSNMNANEVIANRGNELAGAGLGRKSPLHPNDDVNQSQSSNDVFPTVMHVAAAMQLQHALIPAVARLRETLTGKAQAFADLVKIGRTHLMDATPLTLGQEISGWAAQLELAEATLRQALAGLHELALGGSAVGTGLNTHPDFGVRAAGEIARRTGIPFRTARNKFAAIAAHDAIVIASAATRTLAVACMKIGNDVRLLASGPRCGLGEITIPGNEPGSSMMPGKINPTQVEALTMVAAQVMGNDVVVGIGGMSGQLELNVFKPVMIHNLLESIRLLADALRSFETRCARGIEPDRAAIARHLGRSLMLVTALVPVLSYDRAATVARTALERNLTLREAAVEVLGFLSAEEFDARMQPERMVSP
jgi:fumarate hydratase class II